MTSGAAESADLEAEWARALKILAGAQQICLACHVRPDADALGSMLAVAQALRRLPGTAARSSPPSVTTRSRSRGTCASCPAASCSARPRSYPARPQVMMTFDAASADRLGMLAPCGGARRRADRASTTTPPTPASAASGWSTRRRAATAVLARELIARLGIRAVPRHRDSACTPGLLTDTGSFQFSTTAAGAPAGRRAASAPALTPARWPASCSTGPRSATSGCWPRCWAGPRWSRRRPPGSAWSGRRSRRADRERAEAAAGCGRAGHRRAAADRRGRGGRRPQGGRRRRLAGLHPVQGPGRRRAGPARRWAAAAIPALPDSPRAARRPRRWRRCASGWGGDGGQRPADRRQARRPDLA